MSIYNPLYLCRPSEYSMVLYKLKKNQGISPWFFFKKFNWCVSPIATVNRKRNNLSKGILCPESIEIESNVVQNCIA